MPLLITIAWLNQFPIEIILIVLYLFVLTLIVFVNSTAANAAELLVTPREVNV